MNYKYYLQLSVLLLLAAGLKSQDAPFSALSEKLTLCTDRLIYISGEDILFSPLLISQNQGINEAGSRILYCELISPAGEVTVKGKFLLDNPSCHLSLRIPAETLTGMYCLRSYTRFMRNGSPESYHHIMLKIIHPGKNEVLGEYQEEDSLMDPEGLAGLNDQAQGGRIVIEKQAWRSREMINLTLQGSAERERPARSILSVVPSATIKGMPLNSSAYHPPANFQNIEYLPETRGLLISGSLSEQGSDKPLENALVNLSIIGDRDVMAMNTDPSGRFFFVLPDYSGSRDIFLSAGKIPGSAARIFIDNDFCPKAIDISFPAFTLNEEEKKSAYQMAVNQIITDKFKPQQVTFNDTLNEKPVAFYGSPTDQLILDKYIDLPTMDEYFNELPVMVKVRKIEGKKRFRFNSRQTEMAIYDPLVLVDWVAVDDMEKVLGMSPRNIERIELVNAIYIKGNVTYGGIISFISKKNDFAGIDLPSSGTFINYRFLEECREEVHAGKLAGHLPDSRNTVYWNPDVQTDNTGRAEILFTSPDTPGKYIILLREISRSGEVSIKWEEIEVSGNQ